MLDDGHALCSVIHYVLLLFAQSDDSTCWRPMCDGMAIQSTLRPSLRGLSHCLSVVGRWWTILDNLRPIHKRRCSPILSDSGRAQMAKPNRDRVIALATTAGWHEGVIWSQERRCANWEGYVVNCDNQSGWLVLIRQGSDMNLIGWNARRDPENRCHNNSHKGNYVD